MVALQAPAGQRPGTTTTLYPLWYCEEEGRRRWPAAAATRRAGPIRSAARRGSSLAYSREYAALLAPGAASSSAQRGHAIMMLGALSLHAIFELPGHARGHRPERSPTLLTRRRSYDRRRELATFTAIDKSGLLAARSLKAQFVDRTWA